MNRKQKKKRLKYLNQYQKQLKPAFQTKIHQERNRLKLRYLLLGSTVPVPTDCHTCMFKLPSLSLRCGLQESMKYNSYYEAISCPIKSINILTRTYKYK